jgi:hypothetical protein
MPGSIKYYREVKKELGADIWNGFWAGIGAGISIKNDHLSAVGRF